MSTQNEVYRRLVADNLAAGWEYDNNGSYIDFKSADGNSDGTLLLFSVFRRTAKKITFITAVLGSVDWPVSVDAAKVKVLGLHGVIHRPTSRRYQNHSKFWWVES